MKPYDREQFDKYQTQLLYLANSRIGKWFLNVEDKREVTRLNPNAFTIYKGKGEYISTFYGPDVYAKKLRYAIQFAKYLPVALSGLPVAFATTFNPSAAAIDGRAFNNTAAAFSTIRSASGNGSQQAPAGNDNSCAQLLASGAGGTFDQLDRGIFRYDTSSLPDGDTVSAATHDIDVGSVTDTFTENANLSLVLFAQTDDTAIANSDYNIANYTMTQQAADIGVAGLSIDSYNSHTLNATGLSNISKTGITRFATVLDFDRTNTSPTWGASQNARVGIEFSGATNKPRLVVTHAPSVGGDYSFFM